MPTYRPSPRALIGAFAAASAFASPSAASAFSPFLVVPEPAVAEATPAYRYANMSNDEAFAELDRRKVIYSKIDPVPGVRAPVRLTGRLHGVYIHSALPPDQRVTSHYEILDARLLLALDDFSAVLERHDVDELVHYTMYRPNVSARARHGDAPHAPHAAQGKAAEAPPKAQPGLGAKGALDVTRGAKAHAGAKQKSGDAAAKPEAGVIAAPPGRKPAARKPTAQQPPAKQPAAKQPHAAKQPAAQQPHAAKRPVEPPAAKQPAAPIAPRDAPAPPPQRGAWAPPGTRHPAGLAIDVAMLHKRDGRWLNVQRQFHGRIGDKTCGDDARVAENDDAKELRALVCEPAALGIFTYVLTPNFNAAHADHYHMEIKPGVKWFLYH